MIISLIRKYLLTVLFLVLIFDLAMAQYNETGGGSGYDIMDPRGVPPQPVSESMYFIEDLKEPLWVRHPWGVTSASVGEADLSQGVAIKMGFSDPKNRLETAYRDLKDFLEAGGVRTYNGKYVIETLYESGMDPESFKLKITSQTCQIIATDVEGIRRGIFYLEDKMMKKRGAFLTIGNSDHSPAIKRRIIRGYFSPTKRPGAKARVEGQPIVVDELMNDIDYYPEEYLNRLSHEGVNGLWLSLSGYNDAREMIGFGDLVSTTATPNEGVNGEKRIEKLRKIVEKCLRYGIRTYVFTIEPSHRLKDDDPMLEKYEASEIIGNSSVRNLCVSSELGQKHLYEATNKIFKAIPDLGGMINISHGERGTTCLSAIAATGRGKIDCPRCSKLEPWQILHNSLSAMEEGMHDAAPEAELISWLYMPQPQSQSSTSVDTLAGWVYDIPAHTPEGVILQFNFTSGVKRTVFGKELVGGDYWLSPPGPSDRYERIADSARVYGTQISAKIQTGNSHEITSVPYVPVPSALYEKFAAMRRLGVSHTMLTWYFGNAPGIMIKAAGLMSQDSLLDEATFLEELAAIYWKEADVPKVVRAWKYFASGYANYPLTNRFQYYGPMHDGPVWPLLLKPRDAPLSPTWLLGSTQTMMPWPPSGDRVGDSFTDLLSLEEVVELCRKMSSDWDKGVELLNQIQPGYSAEPERILDIGVAKAVGIQFRSGYNILKFYLLREKMFRMTGRDRLDILEQLRQIVYEELELDAELLLLARADSRLGFHPEAEGYKYYPAKIRWRMDYLRKLLSSDFPEIEREIEGGRALFPEYTGTKPSGLVAKSLRSGGAEKLQKKIAADLSWQPFNTGQGPDKFQWASMHDDKNLYLVIKGSDKKENISAAINGAVVRLQPRRLWPSKRLIFRINGEKSSEGIDVFRSKGTHYVMIEIPWDHLGADRDPDRIRMDMQIDTKNGSKIGWCELIPTTSRLEHGSDNPNDFGWLILEE